MRVSDPHFTKRKTMKVVKRDPARERLRPLLQELRCRATEHQESCTPSRSIGENAKRAKEIGTKLNFVDDDQTFERPERMSRLAQPTKIRISLEIEERDRTVALPMSSDISRERGFSYLPGSEQRDDRARAEELEQRGSLFRTIDHAILIP